MEYTNNNKQLAKDDDQLVNSIKEYLKNPRPDNQWKDKWKNAINIWKKYNTAIKEFKLTLNSDKDEISWTKNKQDIGDDYDDVTKRHKKDLLHFIINDMDCNYFSSIKGITFESCMLYKKDSGFFTHKNFKKEADENEDDFRDRCYKNHILELLKKIVEANTTDNIEQLQNDNLYKDFRGKAFLRKIIIIESMSGTFTTDDQEGVQDKYNPEKACLYNKFLWVSNEDKLKEMAHDAGVEYTDFWSTNKKTYDRFKAAYVQAKGNGAVNADNMSPDQIAELYGYICTYFGNYELFTDFNNINMIINGAPGTGKTHTVSQDIKYLNKRNKDLYKTPKMIQFHPSYTYQDFIEGIKPMEIDDNGNLNLQVVNGSFKELCIKVRKENEDFWKKNIAGDNHILPKPDKDKPETLEKWPHYYFVVDEINRGNLSNIFGETFTLLEYRDYDFSVKDGVYPESNDDNYSSASLSETTCSNVIRKLATKNLNKAEGLYYKRVGTEDDYEIKFGIPFNIHFIGMMNDVDRSIDSFDLAFRRRFRWQPMYCDYYAIFNTLFDYGDPADKWSKSVYEFVQSCIKLNYYITGYEDAKLSEEFGKNVYEDITSRGYGRVFEIGQGYFLKIKGILPKSQGNRKEIKTNHKRILFDNYIAGTVKEYIRQMEDDENQIDVYLKEAKTAFCGKDSEPQVEEE